MKRQANSKSDPMFAATSRATEEQPDSHDKIRPSPLHLTLIIAKKAYKKYQDFYDRSGLISDVLDFIGLVLFVLLIPVLISIGTVVIPILLVIGWISEVAHPSRASLVHSFGKMDAATSERHRQYVRDILARAKELNKNKTGRYYYYQYRDDTMDSMPWDGKEPPELGLLDRHP